MVVRFKFPKLAAALSVALLSCAASGGEPASYPALNALQTGQWELREDGHGPAQSLCIGDPRLLLQVRHGASQCTRFVIANDAKSVTVSYSCPAAGNGRTTVKVETPRLVQIDTQGVADRSPFVLHYEGRRVGTCVSSGPAPQARRSERAIRLGIR